MRETVFGQCPLCRQNKVFCACVEPAPNPSPTIGAVERVAAAMLDWDEFGADDARRAKNEGWADRVLSAGRTAQHSGDCTNQPWLCGRCLAESYDEGARRVLAVTPTAALESKLSLAEGALEEIQAMAAQATQEHLSGKYRHDIAPGMFQQLEQQARDTLAKLREGGG